MATQKANVVVRRKTLFVMVILLALGLSMLALQRPASASTFTVNYPYDDGDMDPQDNACDFLTVFAGDQCTLRAAIQQANATPGQDTIKFAIPDSFGTGVKTVHVGESAGTQLPNITGTVTINGYSQPGAGANTLTSGTNARLRVELDGSQAPNTSAGLHVNAPNVTVRGLVIDGFYSGIVVANGAANTKIAGNFLGASPSGTEAPTGTGDGVDIFDFSGVTNNTVGGSDPADRNLISGNSFYGAYIPSHGNTLSGNLIGTQRDGKSPLGNHYGGLQLDGSNNAVGGSTPDHGNTIAFNGGYGIGFQGGGSDYDTGDLILSNSIFANSGLGIHLGYNPASPIDHGDADPGANNLQNYPVLTSARKSSSGTTTIKGNLDSNPGNSFRLQFFANPNGTGEGKTLLFSKGVTTDGTGNVSFTFSTTKQVGLGQNITATATNTATGDTSEFSAPKKVVATW